MRTALVALSLVLAGCTSATAISPPKDAAQTVYALDSAYFVAASAEAGYINGAAASPAAVTKIRQLDNIAYLALQPLNTLVQGNATPAAADLAAAQAAVTALTSYLATVK